MFKTIEKSIYKAKIISSIKRVSTGVYSLNSKQFSVRLGRAGVQVRIGGGHVGLLEYLE